jgi:catechol 2,3-dioxygenase-like lactoylglutathione lyase family enzyme
MTIRFIKETCIYATDLDAVREFYSHVLGLEEISFLPGKHVFFRAGSSVLLCFNPEDSLAKKSPPAHGGRGPGHFAFEVADYLPAREELVARGVCIIDTVGWKNGMESCYFHDPAGNVVELVPGGIWDPAA